MVPSALGRVFNQRKEKMLEIQIVKELYSVAVIDQEVSVQCEFVDSEGGLHEFLITSHAIRQLSDKLADAHEAILQKLAKPSKVVAVNLVTGPTRGEFYTP